MRVEKIVMKAEKIEMKQMSREYRDETDRREMTVERDETERLEKI